MRQDSFKRYGFILININSPPWLFSHNLELVELPKSLARPQTEKRAFSSKLRPRLMNQKIALKWNEMKEGYFCWRKNNYIKSHQTSQLFAEHCLGTKIRKDCRDLMKGGETCHIKLHWSNLFGDSQFLIVNESSFLVEWVGMKWLDWPTPRNCVIIHGNLWCSSNVRLSRPCEITGATKAV